VKKLVAVLIVSLLCISAAHSQPQAPLVARINQAAALFRSDPGGFDTLFTSSFLNQVSPSQLSAYSSELFTNNGSVTSWRYLDSSKAWSAKVQLMFSKGFSVDMSLAVTETAPHLIQGLLLGAPTPQMKTMDEIITKLSGLRGTTAFLAAKLGTSGIEPIAQLHPDSAMALGSAFKLYVLATLLHDINAGKRHWSDVVELDSATRAFPSGEMHAWPIGSPVTLATAATLMISISDNTATDLLIHTLGRENIEAILREAGNTHAERDMPFLTTLEMFKLKSKGLRLGKKYVQQTLTGKRAFLAKDVAEFPRDSVTLGSEVAMIDKIEWFASPRDIANVLIYLRDNSVSGEGKKVRDILAVNPGLSFDKKHWDFVGYKGGSEPGVLNQSFLLRAKSGEWYVLTGSWNDPNLALTDSDFEGIMQRAAELLP